MAIFDTLETAEQAVSDCYDYLEEQEMTMPANKNLVSLVDLIESISTVGGAEFLPAHSTLESKALNNSYSSTLYKWVLITGSYRRSSGVTSYIRNNGTTSIKVVYGIGTDSSIMTSSVITLNAGSEQYLSGYQGMKTYAIAFADTACITAKKYNDSNASANLIGGY